MDTTGLIFKDLEVWRLAVQLVKCVYGVTRHFPREELFGLSSQMQRAAVSIPANIAEGNARKHRQEYLHHLSIARGSWAELETHLVISYELGYLSQTEVKEVEELVVRVGQMINRLMTSLECRR